MIMLTRLNGERFYINSGLIETIDVKPDTIIYMATGRKYMVREAIEEVLSRILDYQKLVGPTTVVPYDPTANVRGE